MEQLWEALVNLFKALGNLLVDNRGWLVPALLLFIWVAWWLWGVHWPKMWARLREGSWAPLVLLMVLVALVWAQLEPGPCHRLPFLTVPSFWWQLGDVGMLVALALFCGWLQGFFGWTPAEVNLEPPAHGHDHGHDHGHEPVHGNGQVQGHGHDHPHGHH